jgi:hypothetical protein
MRAFIIVVLIVGLPRLTRLCLPGVFEAGFGTVTKNCNDGRLRAFFGAMNVIKGAKLYFYSVESGVQDVKWHRLAL